MTLSRSQKKVLRYLADCGHASERQIASAVFKAPKTTFGRPMLLAVPSVMRALDRRGLVEMLGQRNLFTGRSWQITQAGREAVQG